MPLQPETITRPGPLTLPYTYTLGTTEVLRPRAVFASVDGTAASGAFYICVTYINQAGLRISRSFPATSLAAGGLADVSWFPGVAQATNPSAPGTLLISASSAIGSNTVISSATLTKISNSISVTFTTPASGNVIAYLWLAFGNTSNANCYMGYVNNAGSVMTSKKFAGNAGADSPVFWDLQAHMFVPVTGLTPGSSQTWFPAAAVNSGSMTVRSQTGIGAELVMMIFAA